MNDFIFYYYIDEKWNGYSIYDFFRFFNLGIEKINFLLLNNHINVNGRMILLKTYVLHTNDCLTISVAYKLLPRYDFKIDVVYEDEHILIINKPSKILIHSDGNTNKTLTNAVVNYLICNKKKPYAFPIHRIDYETTGIVIFAKDPLTLSFLNNEIEKHNLIKEYVCLCNGKFSCMSGVINLNISGDRHNGKKQIISKNGKSAKTIYKVLYNDSISKVLVRITNGRKHQIRVHMSSIKHPIIGDKLYGNRSNNETEMKLHFKKVVFLHPFLHKKIKIVVDEKF